MEQKRECVHDYRQQLSHDFVICKREKQTVVPVLRDISYEIKKGEIVTIVPRADGAATGQKKSGADCPAAYGWSTIAARTGSSILGTKTMAAAKR